MSIVKRDRKLTNDAEAFTQNAWDHAEWTQEMLDEAERKIYKQQHDSKSETKEIGQVESEVTTKWDQFYRTHGDKFFKDRKWILSEFPEVLDLLKQNSGPCYMFEIGCGVGNALAHVAESNHNPDLHIYCCDLSQEAIKTLKKRQFFREDMITAFQADIYRDFETVVSSFIKIGSLQIITIIFTLSALKPEILKKTVSDLASLLKPGGLILFRDYARFDLTQLRFKGRSYLKDNYYVRADGTTSYFFTKDLVDELFTEAGLIQVELKEDNRLLVNRSKSLKMCRRWIQAKYMRKIA